MFRVLLLAWLNVVRYGNCCGPGNGGIGATSVNQDPPESSTLLSWLPLAQESADGAVLNFLNDNLKSSEIKINIFNNHCMAKLIFICRNIWQHKKPSLQRW